MAERKDDKVTNPSVNIWQAVVGFKVVCSNKKDVIIYKNNLLFLINIIDNFLIFKNEDNEKFKLNKSILNEDKIKKIYPDAV